MRTDQGLAATSVLALVVACGGTSDPSTTRAAEDAGMEALPTGAGGSSVGADTDAGGGSDSSPVGGSGVAGNDTSAVGGGADSGSAGAGGQASMDPTGDPVPLELDGVPEHFRHVRLTHQQWENSVRDNLRWSGSTGMLDLLQPDPPSFPYSNNEELLEVGPALVAGYTEAAETLALQVAADPSLLAAVYAGSDASGFVSEVGRRFYRRPLTADETQRFEQIFDLGSGLSSASDEFSGGAGLVLEVLLQSPRFLYRIEAGAVGERLDGHELATKLAYFITNTTPSDALLDRAAAGELDSDEGLRGVAEELLTEPSAVEALRQFHAETFDFGRYGTISKLPEVGYDESINPDLEEASALFFDRILTSGLGVRDVFLSDVAYASDAMAALYGIEGPGASGVREVQLGSARPGFFTQLPFLIVHSAQEQSNPIGRGTAINYDVLCAKIPSDEGEIPILPAVMADETNRERVTAVTAGKSCEGCHHVYLNPLGFAFENFDGLGRAREQDNDRPIDTSGSYPFVEGQLEFSGAADLMQLLAESQQAHRCYAAHLSEYGLAHVLGPEESEVVDALAAASLGDHASLSALVVELVASPAFHTKRGEP